MFNPFKKKEPEFKLDETSLPSLAEHNESQGLEGNALGSNENNIGIGNGLGSNDGNIGSLNSGGLDLNNSVSNPMNSPNMQNDNLGIGGGIGSSDGGINNSVGTSSSFGGNQTPLNSNGFGNNGMGNPPPNPFHENLSPNNTFNSLANTTPAFSTNPNVAETQQQPNSYQEDMILAKVESVESKMTLLDARIGNIEKKLEIIYRMFIEEVSDETKNKLNLQNMVETMKNSQK